MITIFEDNEILVLDKPSGVVVNRSNTYAGQTVQDFVEDQIDFTESDEDSEFKSRSGVVHRLDKDASGLMVVALTQPMFNHLKAQFKNRTIKKEYLALAHGKFAKDWDEINFPIARSENTARMAARPISSTLTVGDADLRPAPGEKEARTEFFVEKRFVNFTLLRVSIHTGRMHQIRVHLLAYNHPIVGDPLYFQKKRKHAWDKKLGRLFLHSTKLGFTDLSGEKQTSESPLPKELESFLKLLS